MSASDLSRTLTLARHKRDILKPMLLLLWEEHAAAPVHHTYRRWRIDVTVRCRGATRTEMAHRLFAPRPIRHRQHANHGISGGTWSSRVRRRRRTGGAHREPAAGSIADDGIGP